MNIIQKMILTILVFITFAASTVYIYTPTFAASTNADPNTRAINDGITYLRSQQQSTGQISGFTGITSWATMTFAATGIDTTTVKSGSSSLLDYLGTNQPTSSSPATDWERDILAITASGKDPYSFGGTNYVQNLESYHNNNQIGVTTQINDDIFGLLALISSGQDSSSQTTQDALNFILAHQGADGGFSWSTTGSSDVDDTAAAIQSLAAAQHAGMTATNLETAITNAKNYMLAAKNTDGGFASTKGDASNTSTTAWVVMALNALSDSGTDVTNADAYMRSNQEENGSFKWQSSSTGETFTSSYAVLALTGKFWPVKIVVGSTPTPTPSPTIPPSPSTSPSSTPTLSPTETPDPTATPTPSTSSGPTASVTLSPSPVPSLTITQKINGRFREIIRHEHEKSHKTQEEKRHMFEEIQVQIWKEFDNFSRFCNALRKHR